MIIKGSTLKGIILKGIGGFYYVEAEKSVFECKARGIFRKKEIAPVPGDYVVIRVGESDEKIGNIEEILPRKNFLIRPTVANIDQVVVVAAAKSPTPDWMLIDKLLVTAKQKEIEALICLNKTDLDPDNSCQQIQQVYQKSGYSVIPVSIVQDSDLTELRSHLKGKISVFSGQSGVGKSTILNALKNDRVMDTGEVSIKTERGRHTTRHVEIFEIFESRLTKDSGFVVDTPGFSSFELSEIVHTKLEQYYPEYADFLGDCRFKGCSHVSEPDCAVKAAVEDGLVDKGRYFRYCELYNLLKSKKEW